jgi:long-chain acyl-CoA synthetase
MTPGRNTNELRQTSADAATRTTASPPLTLAAWFAQRSQAEPQRVAYCRRQLGVWADVSWGDYSGQARRAVQVMRSLGVGAGDRVLLMGDSRPEFAAVLIAAQMLRAACACAYPATSPAGITALVTALAPTVSIGETVDDVDLLAPTGTTSGRAVYVLDRSAQRPDIESWSDLIGSVEPIGEAELASLASGLRGGDPAYVVCVPDRTGLLLERLVDHAEAAAVWSSLLERRPEVSGRDRVLADVPLAHPAGLATALVLPLVTGCRPFFVDDPRESALSAAEIKPTVRIATTRRWVALGSAVRSEVMDSGPIRRALFAPLGLSEAHAGAAPAGRPGLAARAATLIVGAPLMRRLGLRRTKLALAVGAELPSRTVSLWKALGLTVDSVFPEAGAEAQADGSAGRSQVQAAESLVEGSPYVRRCIVVPGPSGFRAFVVPRSRAIEAELRRQNRSPARNLGAEAFLESVVRLELNDELSAAGLPVLASLRPLESDLAPSDLTPTGSPTDALRHRLAATTEPADGGVE